MFVVAQGCQQNADNASKEKKQAYQPRSTTTDFDLATLNGRVIVSETKFKPLDVDQWKSDFIINPGSEYKSLDEFMSPY